MATRRPPAGAGRRRRQRRKVVLASCRWAVRPARCPPPRRPNPSLACLEACAGAAQDTFPHAGPREGRTLPHDS